VDNCHPVDNSTFQPESAVQAVATGVLPKHRLVATRRTQRVILA
jgi:hypothetical protein